MLNTYMKKSLIYGVKEQRISQGYWECKREYSKAIRDTGMQSQRGTRDKT